ncbi:MAG: DUF4153 domain-containing protein [Rhodobacteraceae bacterium]|nr:DUF4153 domain-containing protein [Paracoccaceae bacterium]
MQDNHQPRLRIELAGTGALAGLTLYFVVEYLVDLVSNDLLLLTLCGFLYGLFASLLMLVGPVSMRRGIGWALAIGAIGAGLLFLSGLRFDKMEPYLDSVAPLATFVTMIFLSIPFVMARSEQGAGWLHYPTIFDHAWTTFVRLFTSQLFMWLVFGLLWSSAYLLTLVELDVLKDLLKEEWFAFTVLGGVFGLSMAILHELNFIVVTIRRIILILLRLLLPFVALVTAVFILLVPFQGLDEVFGSWSAAGTILSMAVVGITLITASVDARDEDAAQVSFMIWAARLMAVVLPVMSAIAAYAIWLRINEYGWTPHRLMACLCALVVVLYSLAYCYGALARWDNWRGVIRNSNIGAALGVIALCAMWLTPVLNAERISANNQLKRYLAGLTKPEELGLWALEHEWGVAGRGIISQIKVLAEQEEHAALKPALARLEESKSRWQFRRANRELAQEDSKVELINSVTQALAPKEVPETLFERINESRMRDIAEACDGTLNGTTPSCAMITADILPEYEGDEYLLFYGQDYEAVFRMLFYKTGEEGKFNHSSQPRTELDTTPHEEFFLALRNGDFKLQPRIINDVEIGDRLFRTMP